MAVDFALGSSALGRLAVGRREKTKCLTDTCAEKWQSCKFLASNVVFGFEMRPDLCTQSLVCLGVAQDVVKCRCQRRCCSLVAGQSVQLVNRLKDITDTLIAAFGGEGEKERTYVNPMALLKNASASRVNPCFSLPIMAVMKSSLPSCLSTQL